MSNLVARVPKQGKKYGNREDGTPKGVGYFGEVSRPDEPDLFITELPIHAGSCLIPLVVPTLTMWELGHLVDGGSLNQSIYQKALAHAAQRRDAGLSPFAEYGEQVALPNLQEVAHAR